MTRSLLLGLDASPKRLGWALVDLLTGEPVACGMEAIDLPSAGWAHQQVARALAQGPHCRLWSPLKAGTFGEVQAVYIEQPALPPVSGTKSAYNAGRAVQAVHGEVERRWPHAPIEYLQPKEWRKLAGLAGNASKADVMLASCSLMTDSGWDIGDDISQDAADALIIAIAGQRRNGENWTRGEERAAS